MAATPSASASASASTAPTSTPAPSAQTTSDLRGWESSRADADTHPSSFNFSFPHSSSQDSRADHHSPPSSSRQPFLSTSSAAQSSDPNTQAQSHFENERSLHHAQSQNNSHYNTQLQLQPPPRRLPGTLHANGSETDSLLDLYQPSKVTPDPPGQSHHAMEVQQALGPQEAENSRWIHRDKLTLIEIQEYQDRGMPVPNELLLRAGLQPDHYATSESVDRFTPRHVSSPSPPHVPYASQSPATPPQTFGFNSSAEAYSPWQERKASLQQRHSSNAAFTPNGPRSLTEIAQDTYTPSPSSGVRPGTSRIPVSTSSPVPIAAEHLERSTPLPRKRAASNQTDNESLMYICTRSRSHSQGSQALLDEVSRGSLATSPSNHATSAAPNSNGSNGSARRSPAAPRIAPPPKGRTTPSGQRQVSSPRPGTRSGLEASRPATAVNRPEGDPPWLATMYKPDPRLPPDEQLVPTHAKRLMQEQWERDGKVGTAFDREFTPVAVHDEKALPGSDQLQRKASPASPLRKPSESEPRDASWPPRRGSSNDARSPVPDHAGYSTMPKVQNTPPIGALPSPLRLEPSQSLPPVDNEKARKQGCACCIVM